MIIFTVPGFETLVPNALYVRPYSEQSEGPEYHRVIEYTRWKFLTPDEVVEQIRSHATERYELGGKSEGIRSIFELYGEEKRTKVSKGGFDQKIKDILSEIRPDQSEKKYLEVSDWKITPDQYGELVQCVPESRHREINELLNYESPEKQCISLDMYDIEASTLIDEKRINVQSGYRFIRGQGWSAITEISSEDTKSRVKDITYRINNWGIFNSIKDCSLNKGEKELEQILLKL